MEKINWYGTYTLTLREVKRFLRVYNQTILTPVVSSLIFLAVFVLAMGVNQLLPSKAGSLVNACKAD